MGASKTGFVAGTRKPTHADYLLLDLLDNHDAMSYRDDYGIPKCANRDGWIYTQILLTVSAPPTRLLQLARGC